ERRERQLRAQAFYIELSPEAAHGHLERQRHPIGAEGDRLTVEDYLADREPAGHVHHLRDGLRHVVELAGEHAHLVARLARLAPCAVELVLERSLAAAQLRERVARIVRGLSEH